MRHRPRGNGVAQRRPEIVASGHFHVEARVGRSDRTVRRAPVRHHKAREAQAHLEIGERGRILASIGSIEPVVGTHHRSDSGAHCRFEGGVVELVQGTLVDA